MRILGNIKQSRVAVAVTAAVQYRHHSKYDMHKYCIEVVSWE